MGRPPKGATKSEPVAPNQLEQITDKQPSIASPPALAHSKVEREILINV